LGLLNIQKGHPSIQSEKVKDIPTAQEASQFFVTEEADQIRDEERRVCEMESHRKREMRDIKLWKSETKARRTMIEEHLKAKEFMHKVGPGSYNFPSKPVFPVYKYNANANF